MNVYLNITNDNRQRYQKAIRNKFRIAMMGKICGKRISKYQIQLIRAIISLSDSSLNSLKENKKNLKPIRDLLIMVEYPFDKKNNLIHISSLINQFKIKRII